MTDNKTNKMMNGKTDFMSVSSDDEKLLRSFFADCRMDISDDGFSDRVMAALPEGEALGKQAITSERTAISVASRRMQRLWTAACVAIGIIALVLCQGWEQIQSLLFTMKIDFLLSGSRLLTQVTDGFAQFHNLWLVLAGMLTVVCVWGYNELVDARHSLR